MANAEILLEEVDIFTKLNSNIFFSLTGIHQLRA